MNLKTLPVDALLARLATLETAIRFADPRSPEASQLADYWAATSAELNSRPLEEALA